MSEPTAIWWVRRDLRLADNAALTAAASAGLVLPVFVLDDALWGPAGDARRAFLVGSLRALDESSGGHLIVRRGEPAGEILKLGREVEAVGIFAATDFGPYGRRRDAAVDEALADGGMDPIEWSDSPYAVAPGCVVKGDGTPFRVFTPFSRAWVEQGWEPPYPKLPPRRWADGVDGGPIPSAPDVMGFLPEPGEAAGLERWRQFSFSEIEGYDKHRNEPGGDHTSRLSPYLKWGCVHPRTLLAGLDARRNGHRVFRNEVCWREFYADVLWNRPQSARTSLQPQMASMRIDSGRAADERFEAWTAGRTGYPIVDAGMRQLLGEAWMHNRVRMIVASFLVKDLHIDWQRGARWFMRCLADGDLASNNHGWQWVAGTGTDAAPYYRVFNPVLQGAKFDPEGTYVRRWVPELASLPDRFVHCPWDAPTMPLQAADYPERIVDHAVEREEALARYQAAKG